MFNHSDQPPIYFFLEADRGTMPVTRQNLSRSSFQRKLLAYHATWKQGLHKERFGFPRFRVLTVTTSVERMQSTIEACGELLGGHGLFLLPRPVRCSTPTRATPATVERCTHSVKLFLAHLGDKAQKPVTAVTPRDAEGFLTGRLKAGVAPKTAIVDLKTINIAFRRAATYDIILKNPIATVRPPREDCSERAVFTQEEVQKLVTAAPTVEWQTLILFGYFLGARLRDCVQMTWDNVKPETGVIEYQQQKTGKKVTVPMHYHVIEHIHFLSTFGTHGFLCPKLAGKLSGGRRGLSEGFKRIVIKAGQDPMTIQGKGIRKFSRRSFHSLRHSFNSALANGEVPEDVRMKLTGHASKVMNKGYTHLNVATLKNAVTTMPLFGAGAAEKPGK